MAFAMIYLAEFRLPATRSRGAHGGDGLSREQSPRRGIRRATALLPLWLCAGWAWWLTGRAGFDALDYYACLALAPAVSLAAGLLAIEPLGRADSQMGRLRHLNWWPVLAAVLAPAAILIVNAFIVPNCAPGTGLLLYALGPVCSAIVAVCMAALAVGLAPRWPRLLFAVLALLSCVPAAWHFLNQPQVTAYGPLVGYIAGPLYEDVVEPDWTWLSYRALDIALWFALVAATHAGSAIPARLAMAVAATAVIVGTIRGPVDGWRVDVETISRALPLSVPVEIPTPAASGDQQQLRRAPSPAMVLHMASGAQHAWLRAEVTGDAREAYARLWSFFGGPADETIHIYLYPDVTTKHRMMGARNVEMAKPWLRQVHMVMPAPGGTILRHEMAHVFAGALGSPPFDVPMASGVVPNALLIEGVAVAAEWPRRADLDPHGQAQAMRRLELAPSLHSLFTPT